MTMSPRTPVQVRQDIKDAKGNLLIAKGTLGVISYLTNYLPGGHPRSAVIVASPHVSTDKHGRIERYGRGKLVTIPLAALEPVLDISTFFEPAGQLGSD